MRVRCLHSLQCNKQIQSSKGMKTCRYAPRMLLGLSVGPLNSTATTSFEGIESAAIGNDRAWKAMVTNYYVEDDFRKVGGFDCSRN